MILDFYTLKGFLGIEGDNDDAVLKLMHQRAEAFVKSTFDREFESTSYWETYDGTGGCHLYLPQMPITAVAYLGTKTDAIKIKNTATDANNAYITIDDTNMTLTVSGGSYAGSSALALATYTTLTSLVAAINALGNGWSAELYDTDYASYLSANLIKVQNYFVGSWDGTAASYDYLPMINEPFEDYIVYEKEGEGYIFYAPGFPKGHKNIAIKYTAGYSSSNMPYELQGLINEMVEVAWNKKQTGVTGIKSYRTGQTSVTYGDTVVVDGFDQIYSKYHKVRL